MTVRVYSSVFILFTFFLSIYASSSMPNYGSAPGHNTESFTYMVEVTDHNPHPQRTLQREEELTQSRKNCKHNCYPCSKEALFCSTGICCFMGIYLVVLFSFMDPASLVP